MNNIEEKLKQELQNQNIVVALSGGPDSMALIHILNKIKEKANIKITVAHVNHNLRKESQEEESQVKEFCKKNNLSCKILTINNYIKGNIENQARTKRYRFFEETVKKCKAKYLLTAHHGDDLIETILMRLTRGSTIKGYQGFKEKTQTPNYILYRPLITETKQTLIEYCKKNNIQYAIDKTNESDKYTRNRYRKYILPKLKEENKNVHKKYLEFSKKLESYENYIEKITNQKYNQIISNNIIDIEQLIKEDELIQKKVLKKYLEKIYQSNITKVTDKHLKIILETLKNKKPNIVLNFPNKIELIKSYNKLYQKQKTEKIKKQELKDKIKLPNNKTIQIVKQETDTTNNTLYLNTKEIQLPLYIRTRKQKDTIELNKIGPKKIKDIFINEKIPKEQRDTYPILTDAKDTILWIPGIKKSKFDKSKTKNYDIIIKYF